MHLVWGRRRSAAPCFFTRRSTVNRPRDVRGLARGVRSADDAIAVKGMDAAMDTRNVVVRDSILFPHGNCMETGFELFNTNVRCPGMSGLSLCIESNSIVGGHSLMCHAVRWLARWPT